MFSRRLDPAVSYSEIIESFLENTVGLTVYRNHTASVNQFSNRDFGESHYADRGQHQRLVSRLRYFCFTAMADISMRALFTKAAAWTVARAGFGSGITPLYTLFISGNS